MGIVHPSDGQQLTRDVMGRGIDFLILWLSRVLYQIPMERAQELAGFQERRGIGKALCSHHLQRSRKRHACWSWASSRHQD